MLKGALHIHSTYSDGELTLLELRETYLADGCRFACVTDHADWFDQGRVDAYVAECAALSDDRFTFVPGLEFPAVDRMHILGYGATRLTSASDPSAIVAHIEACGGISVIAHPRDPHFEWMAALERLPQGLEVWNSKYDGRYAPRARTFGLLRTLQARRPGLLAFYGQDLHWRTQYRGLTVTIDVDTAAPASVVDALRRGAFAGEKDGIQFPSSGVVPEQVLADMERAHRRSDRLRAVLRSVKVVADRLGVRVPAGLKAQARRVM